MGSAANIGTRCWVFVTIIGGRLQGAEIQSFGAGPTIFQPLHQEPPRLGCPKFRTSLWLDDSQLQISFLRLFSRAFSSLGVAFVVTIAH